MVQPERTVETGIEEEATARMAATPSAAPHRGLKLHADSRLIRALAEMEALFFLKNPVRLNVAVVMLNQARRPALRAGTAK
jgi:hypothetical protein